MDPSELPTQLVPDGNDATDHEVGKEPDSLNSIHDAVVKELIKSINGGTEKKKKKKNKKSSTGRHQSKRADSSKRDDINRSNSKLDDSMDESDDSRDPEAIRQLAVLEKLQEELLDLQKTSEEEFDFDDSSRDNDDRDGYLPPSNQQAQQHYDNAEKVKKKWKNSVT